jgi:hypothetical protein
MVAAMETIDYRSDHRLGDSLALQFFVLRHHLMRRALVLAVAMLGGLVIATVMNGQPLRDSLGDAARNAGFYVMLFVIGMVVIHVLAFTLAALAWRRRPKPREIRATITPETLTLQKDGFSYAARWHDANLVAENRAAFLLKFNQLYMRLPKRGFTPQTDAAFRAMAKAARPGANRLGS